MNPGPAEGGRDGSASPTRGRTTISPGGWGTTRYARTVDGYVGVCREGYAFTVEGYCTIQDLYGSTHVSRQRTRTPASARPAGPLIGCLVRPTVGGGRDDGRAGAVIRWRRRPPRLAVVRWPRAPFAVLDPTNQLTPHLVELGVSVRNATFDRSLNSESEISLWKITWSFGHSTTIPRAWTVSTRLIRGKAVKVRPR